MSRLLFVTLFALVSPALAQKAQPVPPPAPNQAAIDAAIDRGATFLLGSYQARLARGNLGAEERTGQSALSLYTMLKCGIAKDDPSVRGLLAALLFTRVQHTYDTACLLLALCAHDMIDDRRWIEDLAHQLVAWQTKDGDWAYPEAGNDLSNTQFAALGLRAASKAGVAIEPVVWERLLSAVLKYQGRDGGFGYVAAQAGSTGSMTAAGVGTLAICESELRCANHWNASFDDSVSKARRRGLEWLATNFSVTTNPRAGAWGYYYLYGIERLGAFAGVTQIGAHDWYGEGAASLVATQDDKGSWGNGTDLSETCFALLFLRRATLAQEIARRGPITGEAPTVREDDAPMRLQSSGGGPVRIWIDTWNKKLVQGFEWPEERGRGLRIARVEYYEGERLIAVELGDAQHASRGARFAIEHVFTGGDTHTVRARVFVATPSGEQVVESHEFEIKALRTWPAWIDGLEANLGPNLLEADRAKFHASSEASGKGAPGELTFGAGNAFDGRSTTPWLAEARDAKPELSISLVKSVDANVVRISPATWAPLGPDYLSRVMEVEVELNAKQVHKLTFDPDPRRPMSIELDKPMAIKRIDVRIVASVKNERCPLVGIGEVELFLRK